MSTPKPRRRRARGWPLVAAACAAAVVVVVAVIGVATHGFGLAGPTERTVPAAQVAQDRCSADVLNRLASPSTATLSQVQTAPVALEPDGTDLFSLLEDPLKGVDHARITVLNVSGAVNAPNAFGATIHSPFTCRAYFVDGTMVHRLVLLDHGD